MLGISISHIARTSPFALITTGLVDSVSGANTTTGNAVGLPDDTSLSYALLRDPQHGPRVTAAIRGSQSTRANVNQGSPEETTVTLARRPMGFDALAPLIGRQIRGQEAVLWETGNLDGVSYTLASPKIWRRGPVTEWHLGTEQATLTIQAAQTGLTEPAMDKWTGFGNGLLFVDKGTGKVDWEVHDPSGDWAYSCYALLSQEQWDDTAGTIGWCMGNAETNIQYKDHHVEATITHATSGALTIISNDLPRPERWYMLRVVYTDSTQLFSLYVATNLGASQLIGSVTGVGARTTTGSTWRFGQDTAGNNNFQGIIGEFRFFSNDISEDDADGLEQGPMPTDADDLYAYLPGWVDIAGTALLDFAQKNASSPRDGTITTATIGTLAGGNVRETSDSNVDQGAETNYGRMPWPIGECTHILCRRLDADNKVFGCCDPLRGVQDFLKVYQGGVEEDITFRETSWLAFYAATLVSAGDCAVYPQAGATRHHTLLTGATTTGGSITADVLGHGPWVRGLKLDGSTQSVDFGTGANSEFIVDYTVVVSAAGGVSITAGVVFSNSNRAGTGVTIFLQIVSSGAYRLHVKSEHAGVTAEVTYDFPKGDVSLSSVALTETFTVDGSNTDFVIGAYVNGLLVGSDSGTVATASLAASADPLTVGAQYFSVGVYIQHFPGTISEIQIHDTALDATWIADKLQENIAPTLDDLGVAVDLSGGLVALPLLGNPFVVGDSVIIAGTTNYNATEVLQTDPDPGQVGKRIVITATYNAETFDGTPTVKPSSLVHHYPGHLRSFPAATLVDEIGSLDGTMTGSPGWVGGVAPTSPRGLVAHVAKFAKQVGHKIDWTGAAGWPLHTVDHVVKSR